MTHIDALREEVRLKTGVSRFPFAASIYAHSKFLLLKINKALSQRLVVAENTVYRLSKASEASLAKVCPKLETRHS